MAFVIFPEEIAFLNPMPLVPGATAGAILDAATDAVNLGKPIVMRELCRNLSLTPGAPYSHFESAAHLESVVAYNGLLELAGTMLDSVAHISDPRARLIAASQEYRLWALRHPAMFGFLFPTAGRQIDSPHARHVVSATQAVSVAPVLALRDGWDSGVFVPPGPGPHTAALSIPGVVSLTSDETRVANALWITTHGAVVLELAIGIHDGWESNDEMFDWIVTSNIHRLLG